MMATTNHDDDLQSRHVEMLSIVDLYIYTLYDPLKCQTFQEPAAKFSLQTFPPIFLLRRGDRIVFLLLTGRKMHVLPARGKWLLFLSFAQVGSSLAACGLWLWKKHHFVFEKYVIYTWTVPGKPWICVHSIRKYKTRHIDDMYTYIYIHVHDKRPL